MSMYGATIEAGVAQLLGGCTRLHYELYSTCADGCKHAEVTKVLFIMGMGATATCWQPQIEYLLAKAAQIGQPLAACAFDNRGVGRSSSPVNKHHYSSTIMAGDALALMDYLGWPTAHIVAFSMGTQIATKLAAMAPDMVDSLTLIAAVGGGWQVLPRSVSTLWATVKCLRAKTPEQRAAADLKLHFTAKVLRTKVAVQQQQQAQQQQLDCMVAEPQGSPPFENSSSSSSWSDQQWVAAKQKHILMSEYVSMSSRMDPQPPHGAAGQLHAVWNHKLSKTEKQQLATAAFPKLFIHGRHDLVAPAAYAHSLAERLGAPFVELPGAHFVTRESSRQVNALIAGVVFSESLATPSGAIGFAPGKDVCSLQASSSLHSILALNPHEEHLVVRPITPNPLQEHHRPMQ